MRIKPRARPAAVRVAGAGPASGGETETMASVVSPERMGSFAAVAAQDERPALDIVIVTWNSERWIERCLRSLPAACDGLSYDVVVYDNSSADRTLQLIPDGIQRIGSNNNDGF